MGTYALIGAILGFLFTRRFFGAILGYAVGSYIDHATSRGKSSESSGRGNQYQSRDRGHYRDTNYQDPFQSFYQRPDPQQQFSKALLILSAEVMRADGKVLKVELDFVKQFLKQQFGQQRAALYLQDLKEVLDTRYDLRQTCASINQMMPIDQRRVLVQYLFGIAQSDGNVSKTEFQVIQRISNLLRLSSYDFDSLKSMFWKDAEDAYKVLGLNKDATDQEVKRAYRKMAIEHHPDKVAALGEAHQKAAKEKFQKVQEAYETIKKERGMS